MSSAIKNSSEESINNLLEIVASLRDPLKGCPWDREQTHKSLIPYLIEEAYEVADAIRENNHENLCEELGDLLFQIVLHSQISKEKNKFNFTEIVTAISQKMIRRHPHVFRNETVKSIEEVKKNWEEIKKEEKKSKTNDLAFSESLRNATRPHPAITGSLMISNKTAEIGFKWESIDEIWGKFNEELNELKEALNNKDFKNAQNELGDVLFTLVNISNWYNLNIEEGLISTNNKVIERFSYIESKLNDNISKESLSNLKILWNKAKKDISKND